VKTIEKMKMSKPLSVLAAAMMTLTIGLGWAHVALAQDEMPADHSMDSMPGMGNGNMDDMNNEDSDMSDMNTEEVDHGAMARMAPGSMQGRSPPLDARDPHAYSDGYDFGAIPRPRFADEHRFASLLVDRLEWVHTSDATAAAYDLQAWYGRDYDRAVLKAEGEVDNGKLQDGRTELLWGHAVATYWDTQLGLRYDSGVGPDRTWLAFGVQGLAPYWFELDASGYVGDAGRTALRLDAEYELLFTQRLILQPRLQADFYGKEDPERELSSGLSDLSVGVRLRYEIRRELAPYIGIEWAGKYGGTANYARATGEPTEETRWVAGVRFWF